MRTRIERAAATAKQNGGILKSGRAIVLSEYNARPKNVNITELIFHDGDTITVPTWLETCSDAEAEQWLQKPASKGGADMLSVMCYGTDSEGNKIIREISGGTLSKILVNRNTNEPEMTKGNIVEFLADCADDVQMLKKVSGHKLTWSKPVKVPYTFRGGAQPRNVEGTVFTITID